MTAITAVALPFMALGQTTEEPQQTQEQTKNADYCADEGEEDASSSGAEQTAGKT